MCMPKTRFPITKVFIIARQNRAPNKLLSIGVNSDANLFIPPIAKITDNNMGRQIFRINNRSSFFNLSRKFGSMNKFHILNLLYCKQSISFDYTLVCLKSN